MPSLFDDAMPQAITLSQFNARMSKIINGNPQLQGQWVQAETSDVQVRGRHCYLELIEKNPGTGATVAKLPAVIWGTNFAPLSARFYQVTGQQLTAGIKVMVKITATFHEQYGFKAVINDINPEFTLGDMVRIRREILDRLTREGVLEMNRSLEWTLVPQRVAIISAPGAAGYGDFTNQLENNAYGLQFYTGFFAATMQGNNTVPSVLAALDRINANADLFDCVVIIRGGGSTSDLNWFDNYDLAAAVAQFPIPVIVGIGHERDVTVLDYVAAMRVKTPTAAAQWLIERGSNALARLNELRNEVVAAASDQLAHSREQLAYYSSFIPMAAQRIVEAAAARVATYTRLIPTSAGALIVKHRNALQHTVELIGSATQHAMHTQRLRLDALNDKVALLSPRNILNRGYALAMHNGHYVTDASTLQPGNVITVHLKQGAAIATVNTTK